MRSDSARSAVTALAGLRSKAEAKLRSAEQAVARAATIEAEAVQERASATQSHIQTAHADVATIELTAKTELAAAELRAKARIVEAEAEAKVLKLLAQTRREIGAGTALVPAATSSNSTLEPSTSDHSGSGLVDSARFLQARTSPERIEVLVVKGGGQAVAERAMFHPNDDTAGDDATVGAASDGLRPGKSWALHDARRLTHRHVRHLSGEAAQCLSPDGHIVPANTVDALAPPAAVRPETLHILPAMLGTEASPPTGAGLGIVSAQFDNRGVEISEISDTGVEFDERGIEIQLPDDPAPERLKTRRGQSDPRRIDRIVEMPTPSPTPSFAEDEQEEEEIVIGFGSDCDDATDATDVPAWIPAHLTGPSPRHIERLQHVHPNAPVAEPQGHIRLTNDDAAEAAMLHVSTLAWRAVHRRPEEAEPLDPADLVARDAIFRVADDDAALEVDAAQVRGHSPPIGFGVRPLDEFDGPGGFTEIRCSSANRPSSASEQLAIKTLRVSARGARRRADVNKLATSVRGANFKARTQQENGGVLEAGKTRTQLLREKKTIEASAHAKEAAMQQNKRAARLKKECTLLARRGRARVREKELGKLQAHLKWQNARKQAGFEAVDEALHRRHKTAAGTTHFWTARQKNIASASAKIKARNKMAREVEALTGIDSHRPSQTAVADGGVWPNTFCGDTFDRNTGMKTTGGLQTTTTMFKDADTLLAEAFARKVPQQATSDRNTWENAVTPGCCPMQTMCNSTLQVKLMNTILREELAEMQTDCVAMLQETEELRTKARHVEGVSWKHEREMLIIADCEQLVHDMCDTFPLTVKDAHNGLGVRLLSPGEKMQGNRVRELKPNGAFDVAGAQIGSVFLILNGDPVHKRRVKQIRQMLQTAADAGPVVVVCAHAEAWDVTTPQEQDVLVASLIGDTVANPDDRPRPPPPSLPCPSPVIVLCGALTL